MAPKPKIPATEAERINNMYHKERMLFSEIAAIYEVSSTAISHYFKRHGLSSRTFLIDPGHDVLAADIAEGLTNREMATKHGVCVQTICEWLRKHGLDPRRHLVRYAEMVSEETLRQLSEVEKRSDREVSEILGVNYQAIWGLRKRYGIENFTRARNPGCDILRDLYITQELTQGAVADHLETNRHAIAKWLTECGIRKRTQSETNRLLIRQGKWDINGVKARHTRMRNSLLKGSQPQQAMVVALILGLEPLYKSGWEIIIGQQNWSILNGRKEVDIPILAMKGDVIVKVALEVDGIYWHTPDDHLIKDYRLRERNWTPFHFTATDRASEDQFPSMEAVVADVRQFIINSV